jgi:uncharacterized damage-inducible protein DinB
MMDGLITEFEGGSATTRRVLERVPEEKFGWKPHEKSMTMGALASHLAENPMWVESTLEMDLLDLDAMGYEPYLAGTHAEMLQTFDKNTAEALEKMVGQTDEHLAETWRMRMGGEIVMEMSRLMVLKSMIISHTIHHRGQLGVYLRLNDIPVPSVYGPSADEAG